MRKYLVMLPVLSLCGSAHAALQTVNMDDNFFSPSVISINIGDTVRWVNEGFNLHGTTSATGLWDSEDDFPAGMDNGDSFSHTFNSVGDFSYYDSNFSGMTGLVRVLSANTPPTCGITNIINGAVFVGPTNLVIGASASDPGGSIASVQFFVGASSAGIDLSSPYSVVTNNLPAGMYALTAVATDNLGAKGTSAPVHIAITSPIHFDPTRLRIVSNALSLVISTTPGLRYALEGAPTLFPSNWMALGTNMAVSNSMVFTNSTTGFTSRFFRARLVSQP